MADKNREADGKLKPGNTVAAGHKGRTGPLEEKDYTIAVREMLRATYKTHPEAWGPRDTWTNAQELVERDLSLALAGSDLHAKRLIDRAEGKVPTAPEDRASNEKAALLGGMSALQILQQALGLKVEQPAIDSEVVSQPALPPKETK